VLFRSNYLDRLAELGYLKETREGILELDPRIQELANNSMSLLSADIRESIHRIGLAGAIKD